MKAQAIRNRVVRKMLRNGVVGSHKRQADTVVRWAVPTHLRGRCRTVLDEMTTDPDAPIEAYGGGRRENVRLTSVDAAVEYLEANDGDVPFGYG